MIKVLSALALFIGWTVISGAVVYGIGYYVTAVWAAWWGNGGPLHYYTTGDRDNARGEYVIDFTFLLPFVWLATFRSIERERRVCEHLHKAWLANWGRDKEAGLQRESETTRKIAEELDRYSFGHRRSLLPSYPVIFRKVILFRWVPKASKVGLFGITERDLERAAKAAPPIPYLTDEERKAHQERTSRFP